MGIYPTAISQWEHDKFRWGRIKDFNHYNYWNLKNTVRLKVVCLIIEAPLVDIFLLSALVFDHFPSVIAHFKAYTRKI